MIKDWSCQPPTPPQLSEAVIGYSIQDNARLLQRLFQTRYFRVSLLPDVVRGWVVRVWALVRLGVNKIA